MTWPEAFALVGAVTGGGFAFAFLIKWMAASINREQEAKSARIRAVAELVKAQRAPQAQPPVYRWEYRPEPVKASTVREKGKQP